MQKDWRQSQLYCLTDIGCPFFRPVRVAFGMFARQPFADRQYDCDCCGAYSEGEDAKDKPYKRRLIFHVVYDIYKNHFSYKDFLCHLLRWKKQVLVPPLVALV